MRSALAVSVLVGGLFAALSGAVPGAQPGVTPPGEPDRPKLYKPDGATLKRIAERTKQLREAVAALSEKKLPDHFLVEVEIYLKAAENIVRFGEWYHENSGAWALASLDQGLERAKQAVGGQAPWRDESGKWVLRAYRSAIDGSVQPYAVLLPHEYGQGKKWRLDVVLHGRDPALTEAKFIAAHDGNERVPKDLGYVQLEVYGRGNNGYRWAGERDVFEAMSSFLIQPHPAPEGCDTGGPPVQVAPINDRRIVLRGFSMGGAGAWHLGLHHPDRFCVLGPGAGFTTTHGSVGGLAAKLPDHQEKCLRIYDAVGYAENVFNVPVVAYSGENDEQKAAADNIGQVLKGFKEPFKFTHLVAPGVKHEMPDEWRQKAETEYRKHADGGRDWGPKRIRFVTYTPKYYRCDWVAVAALDQTYEKAVVDAAREGGTVTVKTSNVRRLVVEKEGSAAGPMRVKIDGQEVVTREKHPSFSTMFLEKRDGKWAEISDWSDHGKRLKERPEKVPYAQGPIDDAFTDAFKIIRPARAGFSVATDRYAPAAIEQFSRVWDQYFRGVPTIASGENYRPGDYGGNLVLFGDPESNPVIARVLPRLPITWTKDELVVNGTRYDPKTHLPVLIYPYATYRDRYIVLNSGHTFKEMDLKGANALLYPRLGDWAVIKPTPTKEDPAAYEVVAAGLFDEHWQFPKK